MICYHKPTVVQNNVGFGDLYWNPCCGPGAGLTGREIRVAGDAPDSAKTLVDAMLELGLAVELDVDPNTLRQGECASDTLDGNEWNA